MSFTFEVRHWAIMIVAGLTSAVVMFVIPHYWPLFSMTKYAFVILFLAFAFDVLGDATDGRRAAWKAFAWFCLLVAALMALWPLKTVWEGMLATFRAWHGAGHPLLTVILETLAYPDRYSEATRQAMIVTLPIGVFGLFAAVALPANAAFNPRIGRNRKSKTGPWQEGWMHPRDIRKMARNKIGIPLARYKGKLLRYMKDDSKKWRGGHHLVVAGTRGGKGVSAVIPSILDHEGPVVVLDIKGENFAVTRRYRQSLGRKVAVLNPFGVIEEPKDQFNPLDYIRSTALSRDANMIADGLVKQEPGDGAHFAEMARQLVAGAIEVVMTQHDPENRNLISVADILLSSEFDATLEAWVANAELVGHRPAQIAATILKAGDRERGAIQTTMSKAFSWMQSDEMRYFLERSSFQIDDLLDDRLDLFIAVPLDQVDRQAVFMRLFVNLVLGLGVRLDGRRKVEAPILLVLDEFVRMGRMEQILSIATVAAGVGYEALFITQDLGQVEKAYGQGDARAILGSCVTKRVFNLNDIETAEWTARHLGESTVYSQQVKEGRTMQDGRDFSYSEQKQKLMTGQQIQDMNADEVLLLVGNRAPLKANLITYYNDKAYRGEFDKNPLA